MLLTDRKEARTGGLKREWDRREGSWERQPIETVFWKAIWKPTTVDMPENIYIHEKYKLELTDNYY